MAAGFALSSANVEGPNGELWPKASVLVRNNTLKIRVRDQAEPVVLDDTVQAAEKLGRRSWKVTTAAGVFTLTRQPCNCGGVPR